MGTWGTGLYSDDFAADLRGDFRDLIGDGSSADEAVEQLIRAHQDSLGDPGLAPVFWLAIADTAWRLGRPHSRATAEALRTLESGDDVRRFEDTQDRRKRQAVLEKLATKLRSEPPAVKRVRRQVVVANPWEVGELIGFRLASGSWTLMRVVGHHVDKGGRFAIFELLDWTGAELPDPPQATRLGVRAPVRECRCRQFMIDEPRRKKDIERFVRTGVRSEPTPFTEGYMVFLLPRVDESMREIFGVE